MILLFIIFFNTIAILAIHVSKPIKKAKKLRYCQRNDGKNNYLCHRRSKTSILQIDCFEIKVK